jgi:hypothetical protein
VCNSHDRGRGTPDIAAYPDRNQRVGAGFSAHDDCDAFQWNYRDCGAGARTAPLPTMNPWQQRGRGVILTPAMIAMIDNANVGATSKEKQQWRERVIL